VPSIRTFTMGKRSQRSMGISMLLAEPGAHTPADDEQANNRNRNPVNMSLSARAPKSSKGS